MTPADPDLINGSVKKHSDYLFNVCHLQLYVHNTKTRLMVLK